jgi:hypothetical protein
MMRSITTTLLALLATALAVVGSTSPATAQEREVALDTLEQAVEVEGTTDAALNAFTISGFGVGAFGYRSSTDLGSFGATKLTVSVYKRAGAHFSFYGQLTTLFEEEPPGPAAEGGSAAADSLAAAGEGEGPALSTEIDNLILSFSPPGASNLVLWLGRFDAEVGFERDDEPLNFQPTQSFNFVFARPVKFTGLLARYTPLPGLSLAGFVVNGWDVALDNNNAKSFGARVSVLPSEYSSISITGLAGPEKADNTSDYRYLLSSDFTVQPIRPVILAGEFNYGSEQNSAADGGSASWVGGVLTGFLRLARNFGVAFRADIFDDSDGSRTGEPRTLQSYTLAPMLFFQTATAGIFNTIPATSFALPRFALRGGLRWNVSNNPFFEGEDGPQSRETQLVIEGVFIY